MVEPIVDEAKSVSTTDNTNQAQSEQEESKTDTNDNIDTSESSQAATGPKNQSLSHKPFSHLDDLDAKIEAFMAFGSQLNMAFAKMLSGGFKSPEEYKHQP